jgi:hypothetical protein
VKPRRLSDTSQAILEALAKGRSCEQILAADHALTYHDIFRAAAEMPENQRNRRWPKATREGWQYQAKSGWPAPENEASTKARD